MIVLQIIAVLAVFGGTLQLLVALIVPGSFGVLSGVITLGFGVVLLMVVARRKARQSTPERDEEQEAGTLD